MIQGRVQLAAQVADLHVVLRLGAIEWLAIALAALPQCIERDRLAPPTLPAQVEGGIAHDAQEPRLERASALESREVNEGFDKAVLHRVERVGFVAQQSMRHAKRHDSVAAKQFFERRALAAGRPHQELLIARGGQRAGDCAHDRAQCGHGRFVSAKE